MTNGIPKRSAAAWWPLACVAGLLAGLALSASPAAAQSDWNPFREADERAQRQRRPVEPAAPPLAPMQDTGPGAATSTPLPYGVPYPGSAGTGATGWSPPGPGGPQPGTGRGPGAAPTIERVELAPLEPAPASASQAGPAGAPPALAGPTTRPADLPPQPAAAVPAALPGTGGSLAALPRDLWRAVDMQQLEALMAPLVLPPRSPTLHGLWRGLMTNDATPPAGGQGPLHFAALQFEGLHRSGLVDDLGRRLARADASHPLVNAFRIRHALAVGDRATACATTRALAGQREALPRLLVGEVHVLGGYCAAGDGNAAAAGLAAELAREQDVAAPLALDLLDAIAAAPTTGGGVNKATARARFALPKRLLVLDYRLLELVGPADPAAVLERAEPALLVAIARARTGDPRLVVLAAEAAAAQNAIEPEGLGEVYAAIEMPKAGSADPVFRRAQLYRAFLAEPGPPRRLAYARQMLDDGRRSGLAPALARLLAPRLADVDVAGSPAGLAETAAEIALWSGDHPRVRHYAAANPAIGAWAALAVIDDPMRREPRDLEFALATFEDLARRGRLSSDVLHRLATVLDALDVHVPIPLWEAASRTPQPNGGHLPETGVLTSLQEAARQREVGRAVLLVLRAIGGGGAEAAHLLALGDAMRALRRVGLEAEARRLGVEALAASWPRAGGIN